MRWGLGLSLAVVTAMIAVRVATAASGDDKIEKYFKDTCVVNEAGWIGKDAKTIADNCACKAKTEVKLADPVFKEAILKKQPYDKFPFGDPTNYQRQVLDDCPALRPLMINAICHDPTAPPDTCAAIKDLVSKLK
jgi:hypothetical protein